VICSADVQGLPNKQKGELAMKTLLMAAVALSIAVATTGSSQAASTKRQAAAAKNPLCDLAKNQRNIPSWNEHYGCLQPAARQAFARAPEPTRAAATAPQAGAKSQYCELAKFQRNAPQWNDYYRCR
jgi:hypothetical protein